MHHRSAIASGLWLCAITAMITTPFLDCQVRDKLKNVTNQSQEFERPEPASPLSAEDELADFANGNEGNWEPQYGILGFERVASFGVTEKLHRLSEHSRKSIQHLILADLKPPLSVAPDLSPLSQLESVVLSGNRIENIEALAGLAATYIGLDQNPIRSLAPLSSCTDLQLITASGTNIAHLPDLSRLSKLQSIVVCETPLASLDGLQALPAKIDLVVQGCRKLTDIDALRAGTVNQFVVDDEMLARFKPWFEVHLSEIKGANPDFEVTTFYSGL